MPATLMVSAPASGSTRSAASASPISRRASATSRRAAAPPIEASRNGWRRSSGAEVPGLRALGQQRLQPERVEVHQRVEEDRQPDLPARQIERREDESADRRRENSDPALVEMDEPEDQA